MNAVIKTKKKYIKPLTKRGFIIINTKKPKAFEKNVRVDYPIFKDILNDVKKRNTS
jgi:hypothetical protein